MLKGLFKKVGSLFVGRKLDEAQLEELEEQLIMSDVSIDTTQHLLDGLREAARRGEVPSDEAALNVLQQQIAELMGSEPTPLQFSDDGITVWLFVGVNGVGKTTTIGKLGQRLVRQGHRPLF